jgi:hypothetical protein
VYNLILVLNYRFQFHFLQQEPNELGNTYAFHASLLPQVTPPNEEQFEYFRYQIPSTTTTAAKEGDGGVENASAIYTRERKKDSPVPVKVLTTFVSTYIILNHTPYI